MWKDKKGISPIVGVILVVAMTVLLAAIAWSYMSGMISSPGKQYQVGMKVERTANGITITYVGGPDQDKVRSLGILVVNASNTNYWWNGSWQTGGTKTPWVWTGTPVPVGNSTIVTGIVGSDRYHITVNATFADGTQQVIYDSVV
jgi:flagellin-like protein